LPHIIWSNSLVSHNCTPPNTANIWNSYIAHWKSMEIYCQGHVHEVYCTVLLSTK
jgi:hypothetical protein